MFEKIAFMLLGALLSLFGTFVFYRWSGHQQELDVLEVLDKLILAISARLYDNLDVSQKDLWAAELESYVSGSRMPPAKICIPLREVARKIRSHSCEGNDPDYDPDKLLADLWAIRLASISRPKWYELRQRQKAKKALTDFLANVWGATIGPATDKEFKKWLRGEFKVSNQFAAADLINNND